MFGQRVLLQNVTQRFHSRKIPRKKNLQEENYKRKNPLQTTQVIAKTSAKGENAK